LRDVEVSSPELATLQCDGGSSNAVAALIPGIITCTGSYAVTPENLEAGQLTFTAQANSSTLAATSSAVGAVAAPVVLVMAAQPQLVLDVVASSCVVLNGTGTPSMYMYLSFQRHTCESIFDMCMPHDMVLRGSKSIVDGPEGSASTGLQGVCVHALPPQVQMPKMQSDAWCKSATWGMSG
jgi:hypothetical protein